MRTLLFILFLSGTYNCLAQDIIVKNDRSEIKVKVVEILEDVIKYRNWEHQDGPLYNLSKGEIFMILYANGQREIIKQPPASFPNSDTAGSATGIKPDAMQDGRFSKPVVQTGSSRRDIIVYYQKRKISYTPTRLNVGFQTPLAIGTDTEFRIIKNTLNLGVTYNYMFPKDDYILQSNFAFVYASLYAPLNRMMGKYEKQDKGLFLFGHAGYSATSVEFMDYRGETYTELVHGFTWRIGADLYLSKNFGITVSSYELKSFHGGIVIPL